MFWENSEMLEASVMVIESQQPFRLQLDVLTLAHALGKSGLGKLTDRTLSLNRLGFDHKIKHPFDRVN